MNLRKKKTTNRLQDLFECGIHRVQDVAEGLREDASGIARRTRRKLGRQTTSEKMVESMQNHPAIFIIAALTLIGLLVAQLMFISGQEDPDLSPHERNS